MSDRDTETFACQYILFLICCPIILPINYAYSGISKVAHETRCATEDWAASVRKRTRRLRKRVSRRSKWALQDLNAQLPWTPYTPESFSSFMKLPVEIRLKIWQYAFPDPQLIALRDWHMSGFESLGNTSPRSWSTNLKTVPITLWICRESRLETLRTYQLCFARGIFPAQTYVDFSRDIIYFRDLPYSVQSADSKDLRYELSQVRCLALNVRHAAQFVDQRAECLGSVEELLLVSYLNNSHKRKKLASWPSVIVMSEENWPSRVRQTVSVTEEKLRENISLFRHGDTPVVKVVGLE